MYECFAFYLFSSLILVSFSFSVLCKNALNAVSALAAGMVFISAIFFLLGAEFLGVEQTVAKTAVVAVFTPFRWMFFTTTRNSTQKMGKKEKTFANLLRGSIPLLLLFFFYRPI